MFLGVTKMHILGLNLDLPTVLAIGTALLSGTLVNRLIDAAYGQISKIGTAALQSRLSKKLVPHVVKAFDLLDEYLLEGLTAGVIPANLIDLAKDAAQAASDYKLEPGEVEKIAGYLVSSFSMPKFIDKSNQAQ